MRHDICDAPQQSAEPLRPSPRRRHTSYSAREAYATSTTDTTTVEAKPCFPYSRHKPHSHKTPPEREGEAPMNAAPAAPRPRCAAGTCGPHAESRIPAQRARNPVR